MTQPRTSYRNALVLTLAVGLALGGRAAAAFDETDPLETSPPAATSKAPEGVPTPQDNPAGHSVLDDGQLLATYQCSPTRNDCYRACLVGPSGQYWFRADYLLWWTRGAEVVPLVTTSTDPDDGGIIGEPTTSVLFGGGRVNGDSRSNFRINFGWWFHCGRTAGIEFDYFTLGETGDDFHFRSAESGLPLYSRPFFEVGPGPRHNQESAEPVSQPLSEEGIQLQGTVEGRVDEYFHSAGANLRLNLLCNMPCGDCCGDGCGEPCDDSCGDSCEPGCCDLGDTRAAAYCRGIGSLRERLQRTCYRVDFIGGYRHYQLNDSLLVHESIEVEAHPLINPGATFDVTDHFSSRNEFHGGEIGLIAQFFRGCWSLELLAKMALGNNSQAVTIAGETTFDSHQQGDEPVTVHEGIFALNSNIGRHTQNDFVVIPQFGAEIGYQINCHLRTFAGYNFIYWANVARASEQVDYSLNSTYFPNSPVPPTGEVRPQFVWNDSDFWAQGVNVGAEYRF